MSVARENSILKIAIGHLQQIGAHINEVVSNGITDNDFKQINCNYNGHEFTIETDYSEESATTLSFLLEVTPIQAVDLDDPINAEINELVADLKRIIPPPAMVQRTYGFTSSESPNIAPDWPEREPLGTDIHITFLLGWESIDVSEFSKWSANADDPFSNYVGLVGLESNELIATEQIIDNALRFMDTAKKLLHS